MEEIGIPNLTSEELEKVCCIGDNAVRNYVFSKVSPSKISEIEITIDAEDNKPVTISLEVEIKLSNAIEDIDVAELIKEASKKAFTAIEEHLRELACKC